MNLIKSEISKILCIKPRGIGDIVLSTVILDNLSGYFPNCKIDYLTEAFAKSSVENNPLVNKVLTMEHKELPFKVAYRLRKEKYDLIFDLWSNPRSAQITFLSGVKYRVGFAYRGRKYAYNILSSNGRGNHHSAEHNLELLKAAGVPVKTKNIHFNVTQEDDKFGRNLISEIFPGDAKVIGIIPAGGWPSKRCDADKWVDICKTINKKYDVKFLILWGPGDENDAQHIIKKLPSNAKLAPDTKLSEMTGLINNCDFILANDSGPMHIAAALGVPTLGIFGPTDPAKHGPYSPKSGFVNKEDLFCIICNLQTCPYNHECFKNLSNDNILAEFDKLLSVNNIRFPLNEEN